MNRLKDLSNSNDQSGFTLAEVLLYLAIFSLVIGAIVGLAAITSLQRVKSEAIAEVNYQGESNVSLIDQTIRNASSINDPAMANSDTMLSLTVVDAGNNPTVFDSYNDGTTNRLRLSEGSPANVTYLTSSHVNLSGLSFINEGLFNTKGSILFHFTLSYQSGSSLAEYNYVKTFYGAATLP
ncbi:MAG TPA: prepilin-type N-terminal cleavage/methylation domain-containing protein [Candidatus Saccharimonadales bacterium]|nr:prepilin-type N-terminal cleavage/methylation domain-containing protein [Candidatus Saccharimonadales bacterium]